MSHRYHYIMLALTFHLSPSHSVVFSRGANSNDLAGAWWSVTVSFRDDCRQGLICFVIAIGCVK